MIWLLLYKSSVAKWIKYIHIYFQESLCPSNERNSEMLSVSTAITTRSIKSWHCAKLHTEACGQYPSGITFQKLYIMDLSNSYQCQLAAWYAPKRDLSGRIGITQEQSWTSPSWVEYMDDKCEQWQYKATLHSAVIATFISNSHLSAIAHRVQYHAWTILKKTS